MRRAQKYVAKANRVLGEIAIAGRQWREADAALRMALAVAESIKFPTQIWKTHVARAKLTREWRRGLRLQVGGGRAGDPG